VASGLGYRDRMARAKNHRHADRGREIDPDRVLTLGWPEAYGSAGVRHRIERMTALSALEGRRLLDVGCGNGSYTTAMAAGFDEAWGIEVEPIRLEEFKRAIADQPEGRISLRQMSAETLEFPDNYFDVVTAIETIEHIENLDRAVTEIYRVLEPGGVFLITAPNRWFPIETHSFRIGGREVSSKHWPLVPWIKPLHRRISTARNFRPHDLEELLLPAGFDRVGVSFLMPQFERVTSIQWLRPTVNRLEDTWLGNFGVSVVAAYRRPA
jgi:ubiquinone/menaquinone biosynthesis C-methylase UbiE